MLDVLIIGGGMYVCGRGTDGYGTILPAIFEAKKNKKIGKITIATTSEESTSKVLEKVVLLNKYMGTTLEVEVGPTKGKNTTYWKELIATKPKQTMVIIATPDDLHFEMGKIALEQQLPTMIVKPLTPTVKEAFALVEICKKNNTYGVVEFHKRFDRSNRTLKDVISTNKIGSPLYFIVEYSQKRIVPSEMFKSWASKVNIFQYLGVHYVDIIYFTTGARPVRAMATAMGNTLKQGGVDTPDSILSTVEWKLNGELFSSSFHTNWIDSNSGSAMSDQKIKVIGTKGRFEADQKDRGLTLTNDDGIETINPDFCKFYKNDSGYFSPEGYGVMSILEFVNDVERIFKKEISAESLTGLRPTFEDSLVSVQVIEAVNVSLKKNGEWIQINELSGGNLE